MKYLVIGNSAAGIGGVEGIRSVDREGEITLVSGENHHTYSRPLISYYLQGKVDESGMSYRDGDFYNKNNVNIILGVNVENIHINEKKAILSDGRVVRFDRLLVATGGKAIVPPISGLKGKKGIFTFIKMDDAKAIAKYIQKDSKVVIIGGGLIGLKAAEALCHLGASVTVLELADRILSSILDEKGAKIVAKHLKDNNIDILTGNTVQRILGDDKVTGVKLKDNTHLPCDTVIIAIGVIANTDIVKGSGIDVKRGIIVNEHMETSSKGIYAAGDASQGYDIVAGQNNVIPIWPNAYNQGYTAGINMAGGNKSYDGGFPMNSIGFFELPMITAGMIVIPEDDRGGYEEFVYSDDSAGVYKKVIIKENKIKGFIKLGEIDRAGIYTDMLREGINIQGIKDKLLCSDFGYKYFSPQYVKAKLLRGEGL